MNWQQRALLDDLQQGKADEVAHRVVRYIAYDLTERFYPEAYEESALSTVKSFVEQYIQEGEASVVLELPDGGISRLALWIRAGALQMSLVSPLSSQEAHALWASKDYSAERLSMVQKKAKPGWWPF